MDPNATFMQLLIDIAAVNRDEAHDKVDDLLDWIDNDGFVPEELAHLVNEQLSAANRAEAQKENLPIVTHRRGGKDYMVHKGDTIIDSLEQPGTFCRVSEMPSPGKSGKVEVLDANGNPCYHYPEVWGLTVHPLDITAEPASDVVEEIDAALAAREERLARIVYTIHFDGPDKEEWMQGGCTNLAMAGDGTLHFVRDGRPCVMPLSRVIYWTARAPKEATA